MITKSGYKIEDEVIYKSLMTDDYAKKNGIEYEELPSVVAIKGDALLDFILYDNAKTHFLNDKSKKDLNNLRSNYCGNPNLAFLMKDIEFDILMKSNKEVTILELATSFEALIYNLYRKDGLFKVEEFLRNIDFYTSFKRYSNDKKVAKTHIEQIHNAIEHLQNFSLNNFVSSVEYYKKSFEKFKEVIDELCKYHSYYPDGDFTEEVEFIASEYGISKIDGKGMRKFIDKYRYKIQRLYDTVNSIEDLNKKKLRIIFNDNDYGLSLEHIEKYKNIYFIDYLKQLITDEVKYE